MKSIFMISIVVVSIIIVTKINGESTDEPDAGGFTNSPTSSNPIIQTHPPHALTNESSYTEEDGRKFIQEIEPFVSSECNKAVVADWKFASNITDTNQQEALEAALALAKFKKGLWKKVSNYPWNDFKDETLRRQFKFMSNLGIDALPPNKLELFTTIVNNMSSTYSTAKICAYNDTQKCDLELEPDLKDILAKSRDYDELEHVWLSFRDVTGKKMHSHYVQYVELINEAARLNNFSSAVDSWLQSYESPEFRKDIFKLWDQVSPLYQQLHAYVRTKLIQKYGSSKISKTGLLPAHLLGDMWAQRWIEIADFTTPYPNKSSIDVTPNMAKQNYTVKEMFERSEEFFTSINLTGMPTEFWTKSIIEKPKNRDIICHASAWDFCNGIDFRIKQCTDVAMNDFVVVHHEMGHIEYFIQYKDQPISFREGANPGFHEAVGDLLALSVSTPKHLKEIGLLTHFIDDDEMNINYLYSQVLDKVAFLPSALVIDQFRWDAFEGIIKPSQYNCHWWNLRNKYQGIKPPKTRKSTDFDPGSKYHVPANVPYIRYFVSHIIQFQFHKALCIEAGQYDVNDPNKPLHKCDIYRSTKAGNKLGAMLKLGSSRPWPYAMEQITGQRIMDASALVEYFQPLYEWLQKENAKTSEFIGWKLADEEASCITE